MGPLGVMTRDAETNVLSGSSTRFSLLSPLSQLYIIPRFHRRPTEMNASVQLHNIYIYIETTINN